MVKSRNGIFHDLSESDITLELSNVTYVFSSNLHKAKFARGWLKNRQALNQALKRRYGVNFSVSRLSDIMLYNKLETRGFRIITKEGVCSCLSYLVLSGERPMFKNYNEQ